MATQADAVARILKARRAAASGTPEPKKRKRTGFLGSGIGPNMGLGLTRTFNEIGGGISALARMAAPGSKEGEPGFRGMLEGLGVGLADTFIKTPAHLVDSAVDLVTPGRSSNPLSNAVGNFVSPHAGEPGRVESRDWIQDIGDRGFLPALVENVGNISIAGGLATAPLKLGSKAASAGSTVSRVGGATAAAERLAATSQRLAAANKAMKANPIIHGMQHPYRTAGSAARDSILRPAEARVAASTTPGFVDPAAAAYAQAQGLPEPQPVNPGLQANPRTGRKVAAAYEAMQSDPTNPDVQAAYTAMAGDVRQQWDHLKNTELSPESVAEDGVVTPARKFQVEFADRPETGGQYADHAEMSADVKNGRLRVDRTGPGEEHLMPGMNEVIDTDAAGNPISVNDAFRAVHDYYGHSKAENPFSRNGEEVAYQLHRQMFSPEAQPALATETRGQNSVLNFSPENVARKAAGEAAQFPEQKAGLLPERLTEPYDTGAVRTGDKAMAAVERRLLARDAHKELVKENHLYDMEARKSLQSPAIRTAVEAGRDHLMTAGMRRRDASSIVGDEVRARIEIGPLETMLAEKLGAAGFKPEGIPALARKILQETGIRQHYIPDELRSPELDALLDEATGLYRSEKAAATELLQTDRKGSKGLENLESDSAVLTKVEQRKTAQAEKMLDRAVSDVLARKIARERTSREGFIGAQKDKLGRIAAHSQKLADDIDRAAAEFDHSRTWVPSAWRTPEAKAASAADIHAKTLENGIGVTFNPHTGEYLNPGSAGNAVGLVNGTALRVAATPADAAKLLAETGEQLEVFEPRHVEQVIDQYQDVYGAATNTTVGTWQDSLGVVHIDPGEIVASRDAALLRGAARGQEATYDFARGEVVDVPLQLRPDIAAHFVDRHAGYDKVAAAREDIVGNTRVSHADFDKTMALNARMAVAAMENGLVSHPDEFFTQIHAGYQHAKRPSGRPGVLKQAAENLGLNKDLSTPEARKALWKEIEASGIDIDKAAFWYRNSHDWIEKTFRDKGDITLLDGSKRNAADLFYQLLAVTSTNNAPITNLPDALAGMRHLNTQGTQLRNAWGGILSRVTDGKITLEQGLNEMFGSADDFMHPANTPDGVSKNLRSGTSRHNTTKAPGMPQHGLFGKLSGDVHHAAIAKEMVVEILAGNTMDKWTPEYMADRTAKFWGRKDKGFRVPKEWTPEDATRGAHRAPGPKTGASMHDLGGVYPDDVYSRPALYTGTVHSETVNALRRARGNPDAEITIYRALPDTAAGIRTGDWVSTSRKHAEEQGVHATDAAKDMPVVSFKVKAKDLFTDGNELNEFGYNGPRLLESSGKTRSATFAEARKWVEEQIPEDVARLGADRAVLEYFGSHLSAKPISFWDNLANPETSKAVTMDRWMQGLFGSDMLKHGEWLKLSNDVRQMAEEFGLPAGEMQAVLWVYAFKTAGKDPNIAADFGALATDPKFRTTKAGKPSALAGKLEEYTDVLDADRFFQRFKATIMGEFVPMHDTTKGLIRVFEDGGFHTLVHENGHLLRRILNPAQMRAVEGAYKITDGTWSVAAEERFANHFMAYMNDSTKAPKGLESTFARVKEQIASVWAHVRSTFQRDRVPAELVSVFNEWLDPALRDVNEISPPGVQGITGLQSPTEVGTMAQIGSRAPKFGQPPAKAGDFYRAGRQGAKAEARIAKLTARGRELDRTKAEVEKTITDMEAVLAGNLTPSGIEKASLVDRAGSLLDKVAESADDPSLVRTPAKWQPWMHAFRELGKYGETHPELAKALAEVPQHLSEVIRVATENGFDPGHVRHFTPRQVKSLLQGGLRLGLQEAEAGTRKARRYSTTGVDRSLEALAAAIPEVHAEIRTNAVIDWVENSIARPITKDQPLPDGYELWSATRTFLQTGQEISDGVLRQTAGAEGMMIPTAVANQIRRFSKDYDHWAPKMMAKVTNPWRALVLTLSPGWYVRNIAGNAMLALAEGVSLKDYVAAWKEHREMGDDAIFARLKGSGLAQDMATGEPQLLPPGYRAAAQEGAIGTSKAGKVAGAVRGGVSETMRRMRRVNEVVDEFSRSAVYHHGLRKNMTPEQAWIRAQEALVDYGALSGFERSVVRSVVPFYSWQRGILKVTVNQAIDHPARTAILMQLGQMNDEYIADRFGLEPGDVPEAYKHLIGDRNVRSFNPFADSASLLSPEGIAQSLNPFLETAIRKGMGAPEFGFAEQHRLGATGNAQGDVNVASEVGNLGTSAPFGRVLGLGEGPSRSLGERAGRFIGVPAEVDMDKIQERLLKARKTIKGTATGLPKGWDSEKKPLSPARKAAILKRLREQAQAS